LQVLPTGEEEKQDLLSEFFDECLYPYKTFLHGAIISPKIYDIYETIYIIWGTMPVGVELLQRTSTSFHAWFCVLVGNDVFLTLEGMHVIFYLRDTTTNVRDVLSYLHSLGNMFKGSYSSFSGRATSGRLVWW